MKTKRVVTSVLLLSLHVVGAQASDDPLRVAATFSVIGDLVAQVAGEDADVSVLTPVGAEVHEWELTPSSFMTLEKADVIFYNGYNLEQWMYQVESTVSQKATVVGLAEASGYPAQPIVTGDFSGEPDPHVWMDPRAGAAYAQAIAETLAEADPSAAEAYHARADELAQSLHELHGELKEVLAEIPEEKRLLITSEAAFSYFAEAFELEHDGIWGMNSETEGAPSQVMRVVDKINEMQPAAIFWESTISDRHVKSVASETGVTIAGPLYVDSLSDPDGDAPNYENLLRHNAELIRANLGVASE
ncbi:zinc ABC transporter substrate-binding protein [Halomonas sp. Bachu 37]|uniref:metal ABC transporter solute-binding protein, Zn/Mn family n=1 Tax=Halomonas kashgarensis TaxID=3084920 RepID=UPI003216D4BF